MLTRGQAKGEKKLIILLSLSHTSNVSLLENVMIGQMHKQQNDFFSRKHVNLHKIRQHTFFGSCGFWAEMEEKLLNEIFFRKFVADVHQNANLQQVSFSPFSPSPPLNLLPVTQYGNVLGQGNHKMVLSSYVEFVALVFGQNSFSPHWP